MRLADSNTAEPHSVYWYIVSRPIHSSVYLDQMYLDNSIYLGTISLDIYLSVYDAVCPCDPLSVCLGFTPTTK